jgi:hypothetical protein
LSIALENTLNSLFADKEEACAKRDEQRRRDKEEQMQIFADVQRKTLEVQQQKLDLAKVKEREGPRNLNSKQRSVRPHCLSRRGRS